MDELNNQKIDFETAFNELQQKYNSLKETYESDCIKSQDRIRFDEINKKILHILNEPDNLNTSIQRILRTLKTETGFDAVGIRLQQGNDYPYYVQEGFTDDFLQTENTLIDRDNKGGICKDEQGNVQLNCTCGMVIMGKTDPLSPYCSKGGSCWSNDKAGEAFQVDRLKPRDRCIHDGYQSVALIPIKLKDTIVGLIQLNDMRKGLITAEIVDCLETIAAGIGTALIRKQTEDALLESERYYRQMIENSSSGMHFYTLNNKQQLVFSASNPAANNLLHIDHAQFVGKTIEEAFPPLAQTEVPFRYREAAEKGIPWATEQIAYNDGKIAGAFEVKAFQSIPGSMVAVFNDITERKRTEAALINSEERFALVIDASEQGIWDWNVETNEVYYSPQWKNQIGYCDHGLKNEFDTWIEHLHPDEKENCLNTVKAYINSPIEHYTLDFRFRHKDGSYRWIHNKASSVKNGEGKVIRMFGAHLDITEQKNAELLIKEKSDKIEAQNEEYAQLNEELVQTNAQLQDAKQLAEEREERFRLMINNSNDAFVLIDKNGEQFYISNAATRETGYTIDELKGSFQKFIHPDDLHIVAEAWKKVLNNKDEIVRVQYRHMHKTKGYICYEAVAQNYFDNPFIKAAVVNVRDITPIKENEKQISLLIDNLPCIALIVKNKTREIVRLNKFAADFGATLGDTCHFSCFHNNENCDYCMAQDAWENKEQLEKEVVVNGKYYRCIWIPLNEEFYLHYIFDITEHKNAEKELIKAKELAEESDCLKTAFLQNMSHEIRTPMNAIMGFSSLLVENSSNVSKLEQFSQIINQRCNDLLDIINDILDISKIESGQLSINNEECNVNDLFSDLNLFFTEYQNRIGKQSIKLSFQNLLSQTDDLFISDKVKLKQILINLITNAFKFTESGGIDCGCTIENKQLVFHVSDTGIGIPEDKQAIVFERFTQLQQMKSKNIGGTGLGLSIVKGLATLLGGKVWLQSEIEKGSTFYFSINYNKPTIEHSTTTNIVEEPDLNFSNKTILIVEDDIYNAAYLNEVLSTKGFKIIIAENGIDAVHKATTQAIDLVLMDIRLPDISGYEATRQIKELKPKIKIIAQTAYAAYDERQKANEAGCIDYISKPTKRELLLSLVSRHLKKTI